MFSRPPNPVSASAITGALGYGGGGAAKSSPSSYDGAAKYGASRSTSQSADGSSAGYGASQSAGGYGGASNYGGGDIDIASQQAAMRHFEKLKRERDYEHDLTSPTNKNNSPPKKKRGGNW